MRELSVPSNGATIAVREHGEPTDPHVVLVHGYPDDQTLWDGVVERLEALHVITYDVRGAGKSSVPPKMRDYRNERLTDDLVAVVDATVPVGEPLHLVGHDWGSIASWDSLLDPRLKDRVTSYVSVSGPSIDHVGASLRGGPGRGLLRQILSSFYVGLYQVPWLPERVWRSAHRLTPAMLRLMAAQEGESAWSPQLAHNAANGVQLYRANMVRKLLRPRPAMVDLPVVFLVATRDTFVGAPYVEAAERFCSNARRIEIDAGHWHPRARPELVAAILHEHLLGKRDITAGRRTR